jgi:ribosomal protein S18 acetylase RimI-like enzyme
MLAEARHQTNHPHPHHQHSSENISLRAARPQDYSQASALIHLPMGALADLLFGNGDQALARRVLGELFQQEKNRFSYAYCDVLQSQHGIAGVLLSYPAAVLKSFSIPMARQLKKIIGIGGIFRLLKNSWPFLGTTEACPDEYYIFTVAVHSSFQRQGLGTRLMAHAEAKARAAGLPKCSLGVTLDNEAALNFYEGLHYSIVETTRTPELQASIGYPGFHRLVKTLDQPIAPAAAAPT